MSNEHDDRLGREVREVWVRYAREQPNPKPSHLVGWDELNEGDKEVDRRIGRRLYELGRLESIDRVPRVLEAYRSILLELLVDAFSSPYVHGRELRERIDRVLRRMNLIVITGNDPEAIDPQERLASPLAEAIASKREEIEKVLGVSKDS